MRSRDQVLFLILKGLNNQQIADQACISISSVKYHVTGLLKEFNCKSRAALIVAAQNKKPESLYYDSSKMQEICPFIKSSKESGYGSKEG